MFKKIFAMVMALVMCLSLVVLPVNAEERNGVSYSDFEGMLIEAVQPYWNWLASSVKQQKVVNRIVREFTNTKIFDAVYADFDEDWDYTLPAQRYLEELGKFCAITDELLEILQDPEWYDRLQWYSLLRRLCRDRLLRSGVWFLLKGNSERKEDSLRSQVCRPWRKHHLKHWLQQLGQTGMDHQPQV